MEKQTDYSKSGSILIKKVKIADSGSTQNSQIVDIFVDNGIILHIGSYNKPADLVVEGEGLIATPGLFDLRCRQGEPGKEQNEDLESISNVASAGGFTAIACLPDTTPTIQSRAQVEFLLRKANNKLVTIYPIGATTLNCEGNELAELFDMNQGGAVGYSNGDNPYNSGAIQRALLYSKNFDGVIFSHAEDRYLSNNGHVNESENTMTLGLKYFPAHAEYTSIAKEIEIARYTNSHLHFSHISTLQSVELIRRAKAEKLKVSCDVSILHLIYSDKDLSDFNSNLKLMPPLRSDEDKLALIKGVNDGTIDCIISDHNPHSPESKVVEFNYSPFGAITLQLLYSLHNMHLTKYIKFDVFIQALNKNPRSLLNLSVPKIEVGAIANMAIFAPNLEWKFDRFSNKSLSSNSHLIGANLKGKCILTLNGKAAMKHN